MCFRFRSPKPHHPFCNDVRMKHRYAKKLCYRYKYFFLAAAIVFCIQLSLVFNFTTVQSRTTYNPSSPLPINKPSKRLTAYRPDIPEYHKSGKFQPKCQINEKEAISAVSRAKTTQCKQDIADVACLSLEGKLYPRYLPNYCPRKGNHSSGYYYGCFSDKHELRDLLHHTEFTSTNSPQTCLKYCTNRGYLYAGLQYTKECFCGDRFGTHGKELDDLCNSPCPGNPKQKCGGYLTNSIYATGLAAKAKHPVELTGSLSKKDTRVKIVFVLTFSGRAVRQVKRLLKAIYHKDHYYYIHVDSRQEYMYNELLPLESLLPNLILTRKRFATIWGGASLLQAHLSFIHELLGMTEWKWDYYINLSESDYPIKSVGALVEFMTNHNGYNFLKSHGRDTPKFLKKQGIDQTFYECENHLWRLGGRDLPDGIRFDGGSDWMGLHREFCHYVTTSDPFLDGLLQLYKYTLLPVESFFHTALQNSRYCDLWLDNNLHITNWNRKKGCKCQNKHIVDWCGCSPNDFLSADLQRLMTFEQRPRFFARKFEAIVNQDIINSMDLVLFKDRPQDMKSYKSYWQSEYHHIDKPSNKTDTYLSFYKSFQRRSLFNLKYSHCHLKPLQILESTAYFVEDHYNGILVKFEAEEEKSGKTVILESHFIHTGHFMVSSSEEPINRLLNLEVGTEFDLKESIFRNFGQLIGPYSDISLKHSWISGQQLPVSVAWIDPTGEIAASYDIQILATNHIGHHRPDLKLPLRPGVWKVKIMHKWVVVAETSFLVTPLTAFHNKPPTLTEVIIAHNGPGDFYIGKDFSDFNKLLGVTKSKELDIQAQENGRKTGDKLDEWVDNLTKGFWELIKICISHDNSIGCQNLDTCQASSWSSLYGDPKSEIHGVNSKTGCLE